MPHFEDASSSIRWALDDTVALCGTGKCAIDARSHIGLRACHCASQSGKPSEEARSKSEHLPHDSLLERNVEPRLSVTGSRATDLDATRGAFVNMQASCWFLASGWFAGVERIAPRICIWRYAQKL